MSSSAPAEHAPHQSALLELQEMLLSTSGVQEFLQRACTLAVATLTAPVSVSITLRDHADAYTVASSDEFALAVDEVQYGTGEGPCLQALSSGMTILVADMTREERWQAYQPHALTHGVRSSVSVPLMSDGAPFGALNIYSGKANAFLEPDIARATLFASYAAGAAGVALRMAQQARLSVQLEEALASRSIIDQALGILMAQQRCSRSQAFDLLRSASQRTNRKLRDVAAAMVQAVSGETATAHPFRRANDLPQ